MDPMSVLPVELSYKVLQLLQAVDLCRCLAVSKRWRSLANHQRLWDPFCRRKHLSSLSTGSEGDSLELCPWAYTYITHMNAVTKNWKDRIFTSFEVTKDDWCCCIACYSRTIVVYYPRVSSVRLYSVSTAAVQLIATIAIPLPNAIAIPDVFIDENYIVISRGNVILVYNNIAGYTLHKFIVREEDGLSVSSSIRPFQETDQRLYVKIITKKIIWLESERTYVVDMDLNRYTPMTDTFRCLRFEGESIYTANDVVSVYSLSGNKLYHLNISSVADIWVSRDHLICLIGSNNQYLEVWRLSDNLKQHTIPVKKDPCVSIKEDCRSMFVLEFADESLKLSSYSLEDGSCEWIFSSGFQRELTLHPEIRLICDSYIFIRPSYTKDENFLLLHSKTGSVLYDSAMPPCLHPPCYIYYLSDNIFITAESTVIHIRCYA